MLFLVCYGLVPLGIVLDALPAAIVGLGLSAAGYIAEILRAGIEAAHRGQREAGLAVGMGPWQVYRFVLLPQAARIALPPLVGALISVLKDSSLASLISSPDIMLRPRTSARRTSCRCTSCSRRARSISCWRCRCRGSRRASSGG